MNLKQLKYFVAIADERQITAAARKLHISQPPLSYELAQLEKELGTQLVVRGPRNAQLTDAGRLLYERATRILDMTSAAKREVTAFGQGMRGTLNIGTISSSGNIVPTGSMASYFLEHPDISFEVHEGNTHQVLEMLRSGVIDVGVVRTPFDTTGLKCRYAAPEPMVVFLGDTWFGQFPVAAPLTISDLSGVPLVLYRRFKPLVQDAFEAAGAELRISCLNDDARTTIAWTRAGYGAGLAPYSLTEMYAGFNLPVWRLLDCEQLVTRQAVVWDERRALPPLAKGFIEAFPAAQG